MILSVRTQIIVLSPSIFTQVGFEDDTRSANFFLFRNILYLVYLELNVFEVFFRILFLIFFTVEERYLEFRHFYRSREGNLR